MCQKFVLGIGYCLYPIPPPPCVRNDTPPTFFSGHSKMSRARGFLVVLHDAQKGTKTKQDVIDHLLLKEPVRAVVAQEPYEHQDGTHIHVFYRLDNPSAFKAQLKHWTLWWNSGRVQVDTMRGEISQACRYLTESYTKKEKTCDPEPWFYPTPEIILSPGERADQWIHEWLARPLTVAYPQDNFAKKFSQAMLNASSSFQLGVRP